MREDARSPIWGGATLGLVIGLILGFFVGSYWTTVLYAVLIGAALGLASNVLALLGNTQRQRLKGRGSSSESGGLPLDLQLGLVEEELEAHAPSDFATTPKAAMMCVNGVADLEKYEYWRANYDTLEAFYQAHEAEHPDIRRYAAVGRDVRIPESLEIPEGSGEVIAREIASRRLPQSRDSQS
jgi:hypothetical protein